MAKNDRYSRLNPVYLARRHAGTVFLFLALGLFAGVAWRALFQPTRYSASAEAAVAATPPELARLVDWQAKQREWNDLLHDRRGRGILGSNIRHALKLAVTQDQTLAVDRLAALLDDFGAGQTFSASLFLNPLAARLGPSFEATRLDLAANLDFQSLAAIVADLDPTPGTEGWDFGFFASFLPRTQEEAVIADDDDADPYLRVLFTLHRLVNGREAASLAEAWRTATTELSARLDREAQFAGGGGFGPHAKRELMREIAALPVLAANSLYRASHWYRGESDDFPPEAGWSMRWSYDTAIELTRNSPTSGTARVETAIALHPLRYPRDTVFTRLPPLMASTCIATLAARERRRPETPAAPAISPTPAIPEPAAEPEREEIIQAEPVVTFREELDDVADKQRLAHIAMLEESVRMAVRDRDACLRRLNAAREDENRLSVEAMNARNRADRLRERYDDASIQSEADYDPKESDETQKLLTQRDAITRKLNELLAYCTVEHPFVKAAFRELEAVEATLGDHVPNRNANKLAEMRATRVATIYLEWETAGAAADSLEERRRRQAEAVSCLVDEAVELECVISARETELADARRAPVPIRRVAVVEKPAPRARPAAAPAPAPAPQPVAVQPAVDVPTPRLAFERLPADIPLRAEAPDWSAVWRGLLCGLFCGIVAATLRELLSRRFAGPGEARRMVKLPVLASLPAYDPKSLRLAAATVKGDVTGKGAGSLQFIPTPVELFEPPAEARRGRIVPLKRRPRIGRWVCGLVLIIAAALLYYRSAAGFAQPYAAFRGALPLPAETVPAWSEERDDSREWGDLP